MGYILQKRNSTKINIIVLLISGLFFVIPTITHAIDTDFDGLDDVEETKYHTNINNPDTDNDGHLDGQEVLSGYSPLCGENKKMHECDFDNDGLNDWLEIWFKSDLENFDTDGDGYSDGEEVKFGFDPTDPTPQKKFDRKIEVDRSTQRLNYYVDGVKIYNFPVSTGNPNSETPSGPFKITKKIIEKTYRGPGYNLAGVKWNMQFKPMYYIHAAYWHNDFGIKTHSHGCINMKEEDAKELYKYVDTDMEVNIIGETPKGFFVGT